MDSSCKYCGTVPNDSDPHSCSSYEEAVTITAKWPGGCPWFDAASRKRYLTGQPRATTATARIEALTRALEAVAAAKMPGEARRIAHTALAARAPCKHSAIISLDGKWHCQHCAAAIEMTVAHGGDVGPAQRPQGSGVES